MNPVELLKNPFPSGTGNRKTGKKTSGKKKLPPDTCFAAGNVASLNVPLGLIFSDSHLPPPNGNLPPDYFRGKFKEATNTIDNYCDSAALSSSKVQVVGDHHSQKHSVAVQKELGYFTQPKSLTDRTELNQQIIYNGQSKNFFNQKNVSFMGGFSQQAIAGALKKNVDEQSWEIDGFVNQNNKVENQDAVNKKACIYIRDSCYDANEIYQIMAMVKEIEGNHKDIQQMLSTVSDYATPERANLLISAIYHNKHQVWKQLIAAKILQQKDIDSFVNEVKAKVSEAQTVLNVRSYPYTAQEFEDIVYALIESEENKSLRQIFVTQTEPDSAELDQKKYFLMLAIYKNKNNIHQDIM